MDAECGKLESSANAQMLATPSEIRDVQVQLRVGIQRPSQRSTMPAHASEAADSSGVLWVASQVATIAATQVVVANASRDASLRRAANARRTAAAAPKAGAAWSSR